MARELSEIFDLDPLSLTKDHEDLATCIKGFRDMAFKFNLGDVKAGKVQKEAKPNAATGLDIEINL